MDGIHSDVSYSCAEQYQMTTKRELLQLAIVFFIVILIAGTLIYGAYA